MKTIKIKAGKYQYGDWVISKHTEFIGSSKIYWLACRRSDFHIAPDKYRTLSSAIDSINDGEATKTSVEARAIKYKQELRAWGDRETFIDACKISAWNGNKAMELALLELGHFDNAST